MEQIRYESMLIEQALAQEYSAQLKIFLQKMHGLNDIKPLVRSFEKDFAAYIGVRHAVAVNSGSDALAMILRAIGLKKGDEVIIPDLTYHAVALAVVYAGGVPVLIDANQDDLNIDVDLAAKAITKKTRVVIAAHMFGRPCDLEKLQILCNKRGIVLIEDVCQAESSTLNGKMLGSFGDLAAFSFSYYKPLSSCGGGGGMVVFNNDKYCAVSNWMEDWKDDPRLLKLGQRFAPMYFMDLVSLRVKFSYLKKIIESRMRVKSLYEKELGGIKRIRIFKDRRGADSVAQNFVVCCDRRDALFQFLADRGVIAQRPYAPLHVMKSYGKSIKRKFPVADEYFLTALHLPLHSFMGDGRALKVVGLCKQFLEEKC